jgi:hypothetical protein
VPVRRSHCDAGEEENDESADSWEKAVLEDGDWEAKSGSGEKGEEGGEAQSGAERVWKRPRRRTRGIAQRMVSRRR